MNKLIIKLVTAAFIFITCMISTQNMNGTTHAQPDAKKSVLLHKKRHSNRPNAPSNIMMECIYGEHVGSVPVYKNIGLAYGYRVNR